MESRQYGDLVSRIEGLSGDHLRISTVGAVEDLPIKVVHADTESSSLRRILITGGVHGDEPAGVEAAMRFLERDLGGPYSRFAFTVVPCMNPTGYVAGTRDTGEGADVNRSFDSADVPEVNILRQALAGQAFDCFVDFHEDWEATGFYLYEGSREGPWLGDRIAERIRTIGDIEPDDDEDDPAVSEGVYRVATSWGTQGLAPYMLKHHASRALILETPTGWEIDRRIQVHLAALDTIIEHYAGPAA
jgi:hypothetical protein